MGPFARSLAITAGIAVPVSLAYNIHATRDTTDWAELAAVVVDMFGGGGLSATALAVAGVAALNPRWRTTAKVAAGIGVGMLGATATGIATIRIGDSLRT